MQFWQFQFKKPPHQNNLQNLTKNLWKIPNTSRNLWHIEISFWMKSKWPKKPYKQVNCKINFSNLKILEICTTKILREINLRNYIISKSAILNTLETSNFLFWQIFALYLDWNIQKSKLSIFKIVEKVLFNVLIPQKNNFT